MVCFAEFPDPTPLGGGTNSLEETKKIPYHSDIQGVVDLFYLKDSDPNL
jgi:hypothetical protein